MDLKEFTTYIVKNIVSSKDSVRVSVFSGDENSKLVEVIVKTDDLGTIIGKKGRNIKALRNIINVYAYSHNISGVALNIDAI